MSTALTSGPVIGRSPSWENLIRTDVVTSRRKDAVIQAGAPLLPPPRKVSTRVGTLAVRDTGPGATSGEVMVLWPSILSDHRIYRTPIEAWQGRHRLIVLDTAHISVVDAPEETTALIDSFLRSLPPRADF